MNAGECKHEAEEYEHEHRSLQSVVLIIITCDRPFKNINIEEEHE